MSIEYNFNNLDHVSFQRLINALLTARCGEQLRLLPLRGPDGGRDLETAAGHAPIEIEALKRNLLAGVPSHLENGRVLFQVKHHRTTDTPGSTARATVLSDFEREISANVLSPQGMNVSAFFLVTNVPASKEAVARLDEKRAEILGTRPSLHIDVLWQEHVIAWLDQTPQVWMAFPQLFAGGMVPAVAQVATDQNSGLYRTLIRR